MQNTLTPMSPDAPALLTPAFASVVAEADDGPRSRSWESALMAFTRSTDWVDARPFRSHARTLMFETGLPWRALALLAGISPAVMYGLAFDRSRGARARVRAGDAARILLVTTDRVQGLSRIMVPADPVRGVVLALLRSGRPAAEVAAWFEVGAHDLGRLAEAPSCSARQALLAAAAAQAIGLRRAEAACTVDEAA